MLELRGPVGGYFVWEADMGGPLLLVAGGSGIVPLMSMLRHRDASGAEVGAKLLYSSRSWEDVIYRDELERLASAAPGPEVVHTLTRSQPPGWTGYARRVDGQMLGETAWPASGMPSAFVCGPTPFVESVAAALVRLGYPTTGVRTERFGPTGG
jgi:ferredoxin-NADP reductase